MRIFTSSWFTNLPGTIQKIGVSRGTPRGYQAGYRKMMNLAPGSWFNSVSVAEYKRRYFEEILAPLEPKRVVGQLEELGRGKDVAMLCYEAPQKLDDWCHRGFISAWLKDRLGLEIFEHGMESFGCGWEHPKIPQQFRAVPAPAAEPLDITPYLGAEAPGNLATGEVVIWKVIGTDPEQPDQALIEAPNGECRSISADTLKQRFKLP
jgi:hypothetical protein